MIYHGTLDLYTRMLIHRPFFVVAFNFCFVVHWADHAQLDTTAATALKAADLLSAGRYISAGHMAASSTVAPVVTDLAAAATLSSLLRKRLNFILVGGPDVNIISKMISNLHDGSSYVFPMEFHTPSKSATGNSTSTRGTTGQSSESKGLRFSFRGSCTFEAKDQGAMFTFPIPHPSTFHRLEQKVDKNLGDNRKLSYDNLKNHMGIMIAASSKTSLIDTISFSFRYEVWHAVALSLSPSLSLSRSLKHTPHPDSLTHPSA